MATETFTMEGLDLLLGIFPKGGTNLATTYLGLWTGPGTASDCTTAGMQNAVLATATNIAEVSYTGYQRVAVAAADWGAQAAGTGGASTGRQVTAAQKSFPAATAAYAGTSIKGFFLCDSATLGAGKTLYVACFDDTTAIASLAIGDIVKITPTTAFLP